MRGLLLPHSVSWTLEDRESDRLESSFHGGHLWLSFPAPSQLLSREGWELLAARKGPQAAQGRSQRPQVEMNLGFKKYKVCRVTNACDRGRGRSRDHVTKARRSKEGRFDSGRQGKAPGLQAAEWRGWTHLYTMGAATLQWGQDVLRTPGLQKTKPKQGVV